MQFAKNFPDQLKSKILISELIGKKVKLKSRGKDFIGLCPFHNEKTPSFTVNDQKGFYHCFGCAAHGDIISFVINNEGLDYKEAVIKLANDYAIAIPEVNYQQNNHNQEYDQISRDYLLLSETCKFFENNLKSGAATEALNYLKKRGISVDNIKKFRLGFAFNSYDSLNQYLLKNDFTIEEILRSGAVGKSDNNKLYDKFRNRIIFPITDKRGQVIAFGGRSLNNEEMPKYLNSSETSFFKKSQTLYNYSLARKAIFDKGYTVIVEGYMDAIALYLGGLENVVATLGTSLTKDHLQEIFAISEKIIICLDGDDAGVKAAKRSLEIALNLISSKRNINFAFLPNQMDPDDFIKEYGPKELEKLLLQSVSLSEALFDFSALEAGIKLSDKTSKITPESKAKLETILSKKINLITDPISKKYFSYYCKDQIFLLGKNLKQNKQESSPNRHFLDKLIKNIHHKDKNSKVNNIFAKNIIALMIKFPDFINYEDENFNIRELQFLSEKENAIKDQIIEILDNDHEASKENILTTLENSDFSTNIKDIRSLVASFEKITRDSALNSLRVLFLKELLLQIDQQYKESLNDVDKIETHQTSVTNQKITELFKYKVTLEKKIFDIEKNL
jgi:DNA primase